MSDRDQPQDSQKNEKNVEQYVVAGKFLLNPNPDYVKQLVSLDEGARHHGGSHAKA